MAPRVVFPGSLYGDSSRALDELEPLVPEGFNSVMLQALTA